MYLSPSILALAAAFSAVAHAAIDCNDVDDDLLALSDYAPAQSLCTSSYPLSTATVTTTVTARPKLRRSDSSSPWNPVKRQRGCNDLCQTFNSLTRNSPESVSSVCTCIQTRQTKTVTVTASTTSTTGSKSTTKASTSSTTTTSKSTTTTTTSTTTKAANSTTTKATTTTTTTKAPTTSTSVTTTKTTSTTSTKSTPTCDASGFYLQFYNSTGSYNAEVPPSQSSFEPYGYVRALANGPQTVFAITNGRLSAPSARPGQYVLVETTADGQPRMLRVAADAPSGTSFITAALAPYPDCKVALSAGSLSYLFVSDVRNSDVNQLVELSSSATDPAGSDFYRVSARALPVPSA